MRISTNQMFEGSLGAIQDVQSRLNHTQLQVSSGKRIIAPSDDPIGAAQALDLKQVIASTAQYTRNADAAEARLSLEESVLGNASDVLQRVRELVIQGNSDSVTPEGRRAISAEVRERVDELIALANSKDGGGEYLFAGALGNVRPFARAGSGFTYSGDQNARELEVGPGRFVPAGDSGHDVFMRLRNGNGVFATAAAAGNAGTGIIAPGGVAGTFVPDTYTITFAQATPTSPITYGVTGVASGVVVPPGTAYVEGGTIGFNGANVNVAGTPANGDIFTVAPSGNQDMFSTVQSVVDALESGTGTPAQSAQFHNAMNRALVDLDQALGGLLDKRAAIGSRLNAIDGQRDINSAYTLDLQELLSSVEDLEYAEATSRLNRELLGLQAAQQTFVKMQGLSLFNFLG